MARLRVIFMGTADFSCPCLARLAAVPEFEVVAVVTQPDRPKGRDLKLQPSPVKVLAEQLGLPVWQPAKAREEGFLQQLRAAAPELIVVVAYGQILPKAILELPKFECLNVHASLLPKYRGAAPIHWAIADGETQTGVAIMQMEAGLDTGPVVSVATTPIWPEDDCPALYARLSELGADLLVKTIPDWVAGLITPVPQPAEGATYAAKIKKEDGQILWSSPAVEIWRRWRAFLPWPGAFTFVPSDKGPQLLKLWRLAVTPGEGEPGTVLSVDKTGLVVACGKEAVRIVELQREGGKRQTVEQFLSGGGAGLKLGMKLG